MKARILSVQVWLFEKSSSISSNWRNQLSLEDFLSQNEIVGISTIDTRKLTNHLRNHGSMNACLVSNGLSAEEALS